MVPLTWTKVECIIEGPSNTLSRYILNGAFDNPCVFTHGPRITFSETPFSKNIVRTLSEHHRNIIQTSLKHYPNIIQTSSNIIQTSPTHHERSIKTAPKQHQNIANTAPINNKDNICSTIVVLPVASVPVAVVVLCPSVRSVVRPVVVARPLSVRPAVRSFSVRPVVRLWVIPKTKFAHDHFEHTLKGGSS